VYAKDALDTVGVVREDVSNLVETTAAMKANVSNIAETSEQILSSTTPHRHPA
jgi:hypothetical protein